jgi:uncharacterized membrane protein
MAFISVKLNEDVIDYQSARRYALMAAFLKIICTILLVAVRNAT